jgi:hypothetical protein
MQIHESYSPATNRHEAVAAGAPSNEMPNVLSLMLHAEHSEGLQHSNTPSPTYEFVYTFKNCFLSARHPG